MFVEKVLEGLKERGELLTLGVSLGLLGLAEGFYPGKSLESSQGCKSGMLREPGRLQTEEPGGFVLPWAVTTTAGSGWGLCSQGIIPRQV